MVAKFEYAQAEEIREIFQAHVEDAWRTRVVVEGFPVCHPRDIISSKVAANRAKDREALPRLRAFERWWLEQQRDRGR